MQSRRAAALIGLCFSLISAAADADALARAGRSLVREYADTVVTLRIVLSESFTFSGRSGSRFESVTETTGTIIQPDGLIVASLIATDPSKIYDDLFEEFEDADFSFDFQSDLDAMTIILGDGEEIHAEIVLRDTDLDLIFVRPHARALRVFPHVDLSHSSMPEQFDRVAVLRRLGKVANRTVTAQFPRVLAALEKPRPMSVLSPLDDDTGHPVFALNGKFVGMTTFRMIRITGGETSSMFSDFENATAITVVPASEILRDVQQIVEIFSD